MAASLTVIELLDGHVALDVKCLDRVYLNGYMPNLQVGGQVASFMTAHLGYPIPSPAIMEKMGTAFRRTRSTSYWSWPTCPWRSESPQAVIHRSGRGRVLQLLVDEGEQDGHVRRRVVRVGIHVVMAGYDIQPRFLV
jgi:hypothetical protein